MILDLFIPGLPAPQGSKRAYSRPGTSRVQMVESSAAVKPWRESIRSAVIDALPDDWTPLSGAFTARLEFHFPRPKSHYRTGKNAHMLRDAAPLYHIGKPDIDKLERAVLDAVTSAGYWRDDSQVVWMDSAKTYAERPGLHLVLTPKETP